MDRIGYHVEEKYFGGRAAQAMAFAQFRANEFGREVKVHLIDFSGLKTVADTKKPTEQVAA